MLFLTQPSPFIGAWDRHYRQIGLCTLVAGFYVILYLVKGRNRLTSKMNKYKKKIIMLFSPIGFLLFPSIPHLVSHTDCSLSSCSDSSKTYTVNLFV